MNTIALADWVDTDKVYSFDLLKSIGPSSKSVNEDVTRRPQGFYSEEMLGLLHRSKSAIAVFSDGKELRISLKGEIYTLSKPSVVARTNHLCFFATKFTLIDGDKVLFSIYYWNANTDPGGIGGDIFEYVERITQSKTKKIEFLTLWNSVKSGTKLPK